MSGKVDGFLVGRNNLLVPLDWKSINSKGFKRWLKAAGRKIGETEERGYATYDPRKVKKNKEYRPIFSVYPRYYWQGQAYLYLAETSKAKFHDYEIDTSGIWFLVFNRDDGTMYEEWVPYDDVDTRDRINRLREGFNSTSDVYDTTKENLNELRSYREYGVERGKYGEYLNFNCRSCPFLEPCWGEERPDLIFTKEGEDDND